MGMPIINLDYIDRDDALNSIIASIALQEAALAHILNADGEKLQAAVKLASSTMMSESYPVTLSDLIDVNESVNDLVETVADIEGVLREKLTSVLSYIQTEEELFPNSVPVNLIVTGGTEPIVAAFSASAHVAVPADALVREEEGETRNYNIVRQIETKADGTATI
ncbi:MAG: hypothetical protein LBS72_09715, partial [Oscillospiraceae bacterium]|nr:hypothetical protein [Oscillospiraceae bacterium]